MRSHCDIAAIALYMSMTSSASNGIENPVVFTTNYDQGVEMAIEETIRQNNLSLQSCINGITSYRVLYPILAKANSALPIKQRNIGTDKQKFRLWWIARDWSYVSGEEPKICYQVVSELAPKDEAGSPSYPDMETLPPGAPHLHSNKVQELWTRNELTGRSEQVGGPILVKLHGSPLHFLPPSFEHFDATSLSSKTGADDCCICQDYLHFIVMSEHQYVNAIMKKSTFPLWAENMLAAPYKHILFMGYSMSDWNIRMQLGKSSEFVSNSGEKDNCTAIVIDPSDSERALLKRLGVDVMPRKLANFRTKLFGELPALHEISLKFPVLHQGTAK